MKKIQTLVEKIQYEDPFAYYRKVTDDGNTVSLLLESRTKDMRYGRQSIVVPAPSVQIHGRNAEFSIRALNSMGVEIVGMLAEEMSVAAGTYEMKGDDAMVSDTERLRMIGHATALRDVLGAFAFNDEHAGLYGAFGYDFVRQTEDIGNRFKEGPGQDFNLFLPSEVVVFDEMRKEAVRKCYLFADAESNQVPSRAPLSSGRLPVQFDMSEMEYMERAAHIVENIKAGELMQAVLSRTAVVPVVQPPIESYGVLRKINPSPYSFFLNMGNAESQQPEVLFGASPELHVKVQDDDVEIRPLAGTMRRPGNAMDDHVARMQLLNDEKERREHTMLVDLARNDIGRVCDGVSVYEYMGVEEYPNLFHLGSGVRGKLRKGMDALDCLVATLPAGTLSGAPKVRAMQLIEELEGSRRGYYGGAVGYLTFNGSANTGITIRSVYAHGGQAYVRSGAGIVHHSVPEKELAEVNIKNANQMKAMGVS